MHLISLIVALVVIGVFLYVIENLIPMDLRIRRIIEIVVCLAVLLFLLQYIGLIGGTPVTLR